MKKHVDLENRESVDQKLKLVRQLIESRSEVFTRQGAVVGCWREYNGRQLGPYYQLRYRDCHRQRSVYLGRSMEELGHIQARRR